MQKVILYNVFNQNNSKYKMPYYIEGLVKGKATEKSYRSVAKTKWKASST